MDDIEKKIKPELDKKKNILILELWMQALSFLLRNLNFLDLILLEYFLKLKKTKI